MPEVSGIIPIYNSARYFTRAANSVLGKTGKHIIDNVGRFIAPVAREAPTARLRVLN
jgi:hypothetical protein